MSGAVPFSTQASSAVTASYSSVEGTLPKIVAKLNAAALAAVESPAVKKRFVDLSIVAPDTDEHAPDVLQALVVRDVAKYRAMLTGDKAP
jgi:hypothetical protein